MNVESSSDCRNRGQSTVAALTFAFIFMAGAFLWLSRTVDQSLHDRTQAAAVAFQGARAGAQQVDIDGSRSGGVVLDPGRAEAAVRQRVGQLLNENGDTGQVSAIMLGADGRVTVTVIISTSGRSAVGTGTATPRSGFDSAP